MDAKSIKSLAVRIADRLYTNGAGQVADRLMLELPGGSPGGGWAKEAATFQIELILGDALAVRRPALPGRSITSDGDRRFSSGTAPV
jgi:hypothetical protein